MIFSRIVPTLKSTASPFFNLSVFYFCRLIFGMNELTELHWLISSSLSYEIMEVKWAGLKVSRRSCLDIWVGVTLYNFFLAEDDGKFKVNLFVGGETFGSSSSSVASSAIISTSTSGNIGPPDFS